MTPEKRFDILIKHARIVDGTGCPWYRGDIGISKGRIAAIGSLSSESTALALDVEDQVCAPGFIDAHAHTDAALLSEPTHLASIFQGITTHIIGQDGLSYAPASRATLDYMRQYTAALNGAFDVDREWLSVRDFLHLFDHKVAVNVAYLIPHGCVRMDVMGLEQRPANSNETAAMQALVRKGMEDGAVGISTGLEYIPCLYSEVDELVAIGQAVAPEGGIFVAHMRTYTGAVEQAIEEVLEVGKRAKIGVHISHLVGKANHLIPLIDAGRARGIDVTFDTYPYLAGSAPLAKICLPAWVQAGGVAATVERLRQPEVRQQLRPWLESPERDWQQIRLSYIRQTPEFEGLTPIDASQRVDQDIVSFICDLLSDNALAVGCVQQHGKWRTLEDVRGLMGHRAHMGCSDGIYLGSFPHPRAWGAFARTLGLYTRELAVYELEEAISHLSSHAAQRFGLRDRGVLREGYAADLVVFNPQTISDASDYFDGRQLAKGVCHVLVNGELVLYNGEPTCALSGRSLRPRSQQDRSR